MTEQAAQLSRLSGEGAVAVTGCLSEEETASAAACDLFLSFLRKVWALDLSVSRLREPISLVRTPPGRRSAPVPDKHHLRIQYEEVAPQKRQRNRGADTSVVEDKELVEGAFTIFLNSLQELGFSPLFAPPISITLQPPSQFNLPQLADVPLFTVIPGTLEKLGLAVETSLGDAFLGYGPTKTRGAGSVRARRPGIPSQHGRGNRAGQKKRPKKAEPANSSIRKTEKKLETRKIASSPIRRAQLGVPISKGTPPLLPASAKVATKADRAGGHSRNSRIAMGVSRDLAMNNKSDAGEPNKPGCSASVDRPAKAECDEAAPESSTHCDNGAIQETATNDELRDSGRMHVSARPVRTSRGRRKRPMMALKPM